MCNGNLSLKPNYAYLNELNLINYILFIEFDNHEWSRIILRRVHKEMFWVGDIPIIIDNDLIHKVTRLRN